MIMFPAGNQATVLADSTANGAGPGMPDITTPNISLEVSETSGNPPDNGDAMETDEFHESDSRQDEMAEVSEEISIPKPKDRSTTGNSVPEMQSLTLSTAEASATSDKPLPKPTAVRPKPTPAPRANRPLPFSQSPVSSGHGHVIQRSSVKDKLLPLREKLADNASKLQEFSSEVEFVPTAEWVSLYSTIIQHSPCTVSS